MTTNEIIKNERNILPETWWWGVLGIIMIVAAGLYYPNYDFSLPYIDHPDEPQFGLSAQAIRDLGTSRSLGYHGYPPGTVSITYVLFQFVHDGDGLPHEVLGLARLINITAGWLAIIPLALLGYHTFGRVAGLLTAVIWVANPTIAGQIRYAIPNNYLTLFTLIALLLAYLAYKYDRGWMSTLGLYSLMVAIVFKTQAIFVLPLVMALPLLRLFTQAQPDRRLILGNFALNVLRLTAFLIWLLIFYPTFSANDIPHWVAPTDDLGIPSPDVLLYHLRIVLSALVTIVPAWLLGIVIIVATVWDEFREEISAWAVVLAGLASLAWWIGISLFGAQELRQFYTMMGFLTIFHAGAITVIYLLVKAGLRKYVSSWPLESLSQETIATVLIIGLVVVSVIPQLMQNIEHIESLGGTDTRVELANYADNSLPGAPHIATWENHKTLNPAWGGIPIEQGFPFVEQATLADRPLDEWRDLGVQYAIMPIGFWDEAQADYTGQVTELKQFSPDETERGPSMVFLYLYPIQNMIDEDERTLGMIDVLGYDMESSDNTVAIRLYWQAMAPTDIPHQVFIHLVNSDGEIIAQNDAPPLFTENRDTTMWDDPDEVLISRIFNLSIPEDLDSDDTYRIITGFYRPDTFVRLANPDTGEDFVEITSYAP